ncbi:serine/threonine protein kinase [Streptomyces chrestomyceticus JCM 4735]|uniref:non-specific serine/threonine protein kinase n=1 Tax=Streptomyces chrestomyceticus JCM 4735 TaxID=1306181 RepID=A0A7U9PZK0_9ACTN|nr:serine/threonine-protein kinase [Streptomyces chrestomyceticus]GCD36890.1 serine/threonine protein kinase [Streptomyces chrestomyceticus JCM 4735]
MGDEVEMDGKEGRLLAGRYRLAEVLGRGGMGTVWRARDEVLGRTVAVKELRFPGGVEEDEKRRLITRTLREAKAIARIRNNGAVTVFDVVDEDDRPWIVMELVEGRSLAEVVRDDGPLTPRRAAEVGLAVLDVLNAAHREGILHRDVKPSNVLMSDDGRVVLTDFGIAQVEGDPSVTSTGMLVGAPSYISPERARGQKPGPPADLWSLGGLLYACVEGVPPYDKGSAIATLTAVMTEPLEPPKSAGVLEEVIYGLLVKDPAERLDTPAARALLLDAASAPEDTGPEPPAPDATRAMALPVIPEEAAVRPKDRGRDKDRETARSKPSVPRPQWKPKQRGKDAERRAPGAGGGSPRPDTSAAGARAASAAGPLTDSGARTAPGPRTGSGAGTTGATGSGARAATASTTRSTTGQSAQTGSTNGPKNWPTAVGSAGRTGFESEGAKEKVRTALQAVRKAAAAAAAAARPEPKQDDGARPAGPPRASVTDVVPRRTLVIAAVVVVLAVLGTVLAFALSGSDEKDSGRAAGTDTAATGAAGSAPASAGDTAGEPTDGKPGGGQNGRNGQNGKPGGDGKDKALPQGYGTVSHPGFHFAVALPSGWKQTDTAGQNSGAIFSASGGFPRVQIDYNAKPGSDAAAAWRSLEPAVRGSVQDYRRIDIKPIAWRGYPTVADWSFTRKQSGQDVRVLNRGFRADDQHGYAIMVTCKADAWDAAECRNLRDTAFATFQVKD